MFVVYVLKYQNHIITVARSLSLSLWSVREQFLVWQTSYTSLSKMSNDCRRDRFINMRIEWFYWSFVWYIDGHPRYRPHPSGYLIRSSYVVTRRFIHLNVFCQVHTLLTYTSTCIVKLSMAIHLYLLII